MDRNEFTSALHKFADGAGMSLTAIGRDMFELRARAFDQGKRKNFIKFVSGGNDVDDIHWYCVIGLIKHADAFPHLLAMNSGGVMDTEFFFSIQPTGEKLLVLLETKQWIDPDFTEDDVIGFLTTLMLNPLFTQEWKFPKGVENYLW